MRTLAAAAAALTASLAGSAWAFPALPQRVVDLQQEGNPYVLAGFLPVDLYDGWGGHAVDPTGVEDSTAALNRALLDGRDAGLVTLLLPGTYRVSDTLLGVQEYQAWGCADHFGKPIGDGRPNVDWGTGFVMRKAPSLVGLGTGPKPVLRLADSSAGFQDPAKPKPVLSFYNDGPGYPPQPDWWHQGDCGMNIHVRNLEVQVGSGNPGAVALQMPSAQYSALQDVRLDATGGFAGLRGLTQTKAVVNVEVVGGRYGVIFNLGSEYAAGLTLRDQEAAAILIDAYSPITLVGLKIEKAQGPAILIDGSLLGAGNQGSQLTVVDGSIALAGGTAPAIQNELWGGGSSLYLHEVYVQAPGTLVQSGGSSLAKAAGAWTRIRDYSYSDTRSGYAGVTTTTWIDGVQGAPDLAVVEPASSVPADLLTRHAGRRLPWFEDPGVKNVRDADIGAWGDGQHDDTAALQKAIDLHRVVFLPRGDYLVSGTLNLKADTQLFGVYSGKTRLVAKGWAPGAETPFLRTADDAAATTLLSDVWVMLPGGWDQSWLGAVDWRAGRSSIVNELYYDLAWETETATHPRSLLRVGGHGGGRWYGTILFQQYAGRTADPGFRSLLVVGTAEPLTFYGLNGEYSNSVMTEVRDARNVRVLGNKTEVRHPYLVLSNASNVMHAGISGHCQDDFGVPCSAATAVKLVQLTGSSDLLLANETLYASSHGAARMIDELDSGAFLEGTRNCSVYKRGAFDDSVFPRCGDSRCDPWTESSATCPGDCAGSGPVCGNGVCESGEACDACSDCGSCPKPACRATMTVDADAADWAAVDALELPASKAILSAGTPVAPSGDGDCSAAVRLAWDDDYLYALVEVTDDAVKAESADLYDDDSVELYLDGMHERAASYDANDWQLTLTADGRIGGVKAPPAMAKKAAKATAAGYTVEVAVPWSALGSAAPAADRVLGLDLAVNDDDDGAVRDSQLVLLGDGSSWSNPSKMGALVLRPESCGTPRPDAGVPGADAAAPANDAAPQAVDSGAAGPADGSVGVPDGGSASKADAGSSSLASGGCGCGSGGAAISPLIAFFALTLLRPRRRKR